MHNGRKQQQIDIHSNQYFSKSKQNSDFFFFFFSDDGTVNQAF